MEFKLPIIANKLPVLSPSVVINYPNLRHSDCPSHGTPLPKSRHSTTDEWLFQCPTNTMIDWRTTTLLTIPIRQLCYFYHRTTSLSLPLPIYLCLSAITYYIKLSVKLSLSSRCRCLSPRICMKCRCCDLAAAQLCRSLDCCRGLCFASNG